MSYTRAGLALGIAATALVAGSASAAPARACGLITDAPNDTFAVRAQDSQKAYGPQEDALDIIGGDIATDAKSFTAVVRVKKLAMSAGTSPGGLSYRVSFYTPEGAAATPVARAFFVEGRIEPSGTTTFLAGYRDNVANGPSNFLGAGTGVFDVKASEVRITAPLSLWASTTGGVKPGMLLDLTGLDQSSGRYTVTNPATGGGAAAPFADVAASEKTYKAGTPSCVVVGK